MTDIPNSRYDVAAALARLEPITIANSQTLDTSSADDLLKVLSKLARSHLRSQQEIALTSDEIRKSLERQGELIEGLRRGKEGLFSRNEKLIRFILELVDALSGLREWGARSENSEVKKLSNDLDHSVRLSMQKLGLSEIPSLRMKPDSVYHFVLERRPTTDPSSRGIILEVVRTGYLLGDEVIRKSDVIVGT